MLLSAGTLNISVPTIRQVKTFGHLYCGGIFRFLKSSVLDFYIFFFFFTSSSICIICLLIKTKCAAWAVCQGSFRNGAISIVPCPPKPLLSVEGLGI